jgi:DNA-binding LacI/PurR family transcriptional regulator
MSAKVTIATVARHARVSRQTVSNVINSPHLVREETRARVRAAIEALGYRASQAARQMRTGRSRLIAVRIEPTRDGINGSVFDRFLHGLTEAAALGGYRVMLYTAEDDEGEIAACEELLASHDLDAFVLTSTHHGDPRTSWLAERDVPFVTFGRPWGEDGAHPWVDVDGRAGTAEATARLLAAGHRRIGFLGWPAGPGIGDDRRSGWTETLTAAGIDPTGLESTTEDRVVDGVQAAGQIMARPDPPTALVCVSDSLALGALQGAPGVPVIGFDDTPVAHAVGLTSVSQPLAEAAAACMRLLVGLLDQQAGRRPSSALRTSRQQPALPTSQQKSAVPTSRQQAVLLRPHLVIRSSG